MESLKSNETPQIHNPTTSFMNWVQEDGFVYGDSGTTPSEKILALDMDDTLIRTKTGHSFPKDETDWVFWHDKVVVTVQEYHSKGFKIVIITNQGGIEKGSTKLEHIQKKIEMIVKEINVPVQAMIATHKNYYRKPSPGLWKYMCENLNGGVKVDMNVSIFCGDAAGRPKTGEKSADFENTDYKFALNCGLIFKTPEMLYHNIHEDLPDIEFHPKKLRASESSHIEAEVMIRKNKEKEMIILFGPPPSGKTTFYKNYLASDYIHINYKTLKTRPKCLKAAEKALEEGKSVVIDHCLAHNEKRKDYIELAKKHGFTVRALVFEVDQHLSKHLNDLRVYNKHRNHDSPATPKLVINKWFKEFVEPTVEEGFDSVEKIKFVPGPFENQHDEEMFFSYVSTMR